MKREISDNFYFYLTSVPLFNEFLHRDHHFIIIPQHTLFGQYCLGLLGLKKEKGFNL